MSKSTATKNEKKPAVKASQPEKAARTLLPQKNGITQPKEGTKTRKVWDIAEKMTEKTGSTAVRADVIEAAVKVGIDQGTAATQYGYWRQYHGITGRIGSPKAEKPAKKEAAKAPAKVPAAPKAPATKKEAPKAPKVPAAPKSGTVPPPPVA